MLNLRNTERTTDTITIEWDAIDSVDCGPVLYYVVVIRNLAISCDINSFNITISRADFHNLINDVPYAVSVAAVNRAGVGVGTTINVTTLAATSSGRLQGALYNSTLPLKDKIVLAHKFLLSSKALSTCLTCNSYKS